MSADPDDKPVPRFRRSDEFSRFGVEPKVWFRAPENKTLAAQCASVFGDVKPRIGTIVLRYETDDKGTILANAGYKLTALITNVEKYQTIQNLIRGGWNLFDHDLLISCGRGADDKQWQHLTFTPAPESFLRRAPADFQAQITAEAEVLFNGALCKKFAKALPDEEILKLLGAHSFGGQLPMANPGNPFVQQPTASQFSGSTEPGPASAPPGSAFSDLVAKETRTHKQQHAV